jgi:hypothetical protein
MAWYFVKHKDNFTFTNGIIVRNAYSFTRDMNQEPDL